MKKALIFNIAAFYLLLTTGMFVCIVHCAGDFFFNSQIALHDDHDEDHEAKEHHHEKEKDCKGDKDCSCCNKHDNFVVKENVKPGLDFSAPEIAILAYYSFFVHPVTDYPVVRFSAWHQSNAPPALSGKSIVIKLRTLLI